MNFDLSHRQRNLQWAALEFARGEFAPDLAMALDRSGRFPETVWKKAGQLDLIGVHYPREFGGLGLGILETVLVIESLCRVDSGFGSALASVDLGSEIILKFGKEEQKEKFIRPVVKAHKLLTVVAPESEVEKTVSVTSTRSHNHGEKYFLCGADEFVVNAPSADDFVVICYDAKEGWTTLLLEASQEGILIIPVEAMGLRMVQGGSVTFQDVQVGAGNRVGGEGAGAIHRSHFHQERRLKTLAQGLGAAQGAFDRALQYSKDREQFGRRLSQLQIIRHKLAEMAAGIEVLRCLIYKAAFDYDHGKLEPVLLAIAEIETGRRLIRIVDETIQIFGGHGYMSEQGVERCYRDAWALAALFGTEEEKKDVIAQKIVGPLGLQSKPDK